MLAKDAGEKTGCAEPVVGGLYLLACPKPKRRVLTINQSLLRFPGDSKFLRFSQTVRLLDTPKDITQQLLFNQVVLPANFLSKDRRRDVWSAQSGKCLG